MKRLIVKRITRVMGYMLGLVAVTATLGGHWIALQTVAWSCMMVDYTRAENLRSAITKTFDGSHPCGLCLAIRDGRQQEQQENKKTIFTNLEKGFDFVLESRAPILPERSQVSRLSVPRIPALHRALVHAPPSPPPRQPAA